MSERFTDALNAWAERDQEKEFLLKMAREHNPDSAGLTEEQENRLRFYDSLLEQYSIRITTAFDHDQMKDFMHKAPDTTTGYEEY